MTDTFKNYTFSTEVVDQKDGVAKIRNAYSIMADPNDEIIRTDEQIRIMQKYRARLIAEFNIIDYYTLLLSYEDNQSINERNFEVVFTDFFDTLYKIFEDELTTRFKIGYYTPYMDYSDQNRFSYFNMPDDIFNMFITEYVLPRYFDKMVDIFGPSNTIYFGGLDFYRNMFALHVLNKINESREMIQSLKEEEESLNIATLDEWNDTNQDPGYVNLLTKNLRKKGMRIDRYGYAKLDYDNPVILQRTKIEVNDVPEFISHTYFRLREDEKEAQDTHGIRVLSDSIDDYYKKYGTTELKKFRYIFSTLDDSTDRQFIKEVDDIETGKRYVSKVALLAYIMDRVIDNRERFGYINYEGDLERLENNASIIFPWCLPREYSKYNQILEQFNVKYKTSLKDVSRLRNRLRHKLNKKTIKVDEKVGYFKKVLPVKYKKYNFNDDDTMNCPLTCIKSFLEDKLSEYYSNSENVQYKILAQIYSNSKLTNISNFIITKSLLKKFWLTLCKMYKINMIINLYSYPKNEKIKDPDNHKRRYLFLGDNTEIPEIPPGVYYANKTMKGARVNAIIAKVRETLKDVKSIPVVLLDHHVFNCNVKGSVKDLANVAMEYDSYPLKKNCEQVIYKSHIKLINEQVKNIEDVPNQLLGAPISQLCSKVKTDDLLLKYIPDKDIKNEKGQITEFSQVSYAAFDYEFTAKTYNEKYQNHSKLKSKIYGTKNSNKLNSNVTSVVKSQTYSNLCIPFTNDDSPIKDYFFSYSKIHHNNFFDMINYLIKKTPHNYCIPTQKELDKHAKAGTVPSDRFLKHTWILFSHYGAKVDTIISQDIIMNSNLQQKFKDIGVKILEVSGANIDLTWTISRFIDGKSQKITFSFRDSFKIMSCKAADIPRNFGVEAVKLPYFYNYYQHIMNLKESPPLDISKYDFKYPDTYEKFESDNRLFKIPTELKNITTDQIKEKFNEEQLTTMALEAGLRCSAHLLATIDTYNTRATNLKFFRDYQQKIREPDPKKAYFSFLKEYCPIYDLYEAPESLSVTDLAISPRLFNDLMINRHQYWNGSKKLPELANYQWSEKLMRESLGTKDLIRIICIKNGHYSFPDGKGGEEAITKNPEIIEKIDNYRNKYLLDENKKMNCILLNNRAWCELYNFYDSLLIVEGLRKFQKSIHEIPNIAKEISDIEIPTINNLTKINILQERSISGIAWHCAAIVGCFDNTYKMLGGLNAFIRKSIVGGQCIKNPNSKRFQSEHFDEIMSYINTDENPETSERLRKLLKESSMLDFDGVSLYSSAISILGLAMGEPYYLYNESDLRQAVSEKLPFWVCCSFETKLNVEMPYLSEKIDGIRQFRCGQFNNIVLGDSAFIHMVRNEGVNHLKVPCNGHPIGIAFKQRCWRLSKYIKVLFRGRQIAKKKKNSVASEVLKLQMNSIFGRSIMKESDQQRRLIHKDDYEDFKQKNYNKMIGRVIDHGNYMEVGIHTDFQSRSGFPQIGAAILETSKDIMNWATWYLTNPDEALADGCKQFVTLKELIENRVKIGNGKLKCAINYRDTDSLAIEYKYLPLVQHMVGLNLCQFHNDFNEDDKITEIGQVAIRSEFIGKKCYIHETIGIADGKYKLSYHRSLKGVPSKALNVPFDDFKSINDGEIRRYPTRIAGNIGMQVIKGDGLYYKTSTEYREIKKPDYNKDKYYYITGEYAIKQHWPKDKPLEMDKVLNKEKIDALTAYNEKIRRTDIMILEHDNGKFNPVPGSVRDRLITA